MSSNRGLVIKTEDFGVMDILEFTTRFHAPTLICPTSICKIFLTQSSLTGTQGQSTGHNQSRAGSQQKWLESPFPSELKSTLKILTGTKDHAIPPLSSSLPVYFVSGTPPQNPAVGVSRQSSASSYVLCKWGHHLLGHLGFKSHCLQLGIRMKHNVYGGSNFIGTIPRSNQKQTVN